MINEGWAIMSGGNTRRIDETFQQVTHAGNAGQYDRAQILEEINRLKGAAAPELLTDLGKGWHDAAGKLDELRSRVQRVGGQLAEAWRSQASVASQRALMHLHDAAQDLSGTADGMHRYTDQVGATMAQHLASFPGGDGEGAMEGFMGEYGRVLASGAAGPAGLVPGNPAGDVGEAVYGTVGSWVDSGLGALGLGGGDPNQRYQEALAALNRDLVADNTIMPNHLSIELPEIGGSGGDTGVGGLPDGGLPPGAPGGGGLSNPGGGSNLPGGGRRPSMDPAIGQRDAYAQPGEINPPDIGADSRGAHRGPGEPSGGLAGGSGGPSVPGGPGSTIGGTPAVGGGLGIGTGGDVGGVPGGAGVRPGIARGMVGTGGTGPGGRGPSMGNSVGRGAGAAPGASGRTSVGGGMMPVGTGGAGTGNSAGSGGRTGPGRSGSGRMAGGMMPMGGAGGRDQDDGSSHESWLVEDDDPWGAGEADNLPPGVIK